MWAGSRRASLGARLLELKLDRGHAVDLAAALGGLEVPIMKVAQLHRRRAAAGICRRTHKSAEPGPAIGWACVKRRHGGRLGRDWQTKFAAFKHHPAAAASLGQVHRAHAHEGMELACKLGTPICSPRSKPT